MFIARIIAFIFLLCANANAAGLTPVLLENGEANHACTGSNYITQSYPVNGNVAAIYIFATSNVATVDIALVDQSNTTYGTVADIHKLTATGFNLWSWESYRSFQPDTVAATTINAYLYCAAGAGKYVNIYVVAYLRALP